MKKARKRASAAKRVGPDEILPEYDFSKAERNKYASRYARGSAVVVLEPDVAAVFPTSREVNEALRGIARMVLKRRRWPIYAGCMERGLMLVIVMLTGSLVSAQQPGAAASAASVEQQVATLVKQHIAWGPAASTPNTKLVLKESARSGSEVKFQLFAENLPKEAIYSLVSWPVTAKGPAVTIQGVTLNEAGMAICSGKPGNCSGQRPNEPVDLVAHPVPGEPLRVGLVSIDGLIKAFVKTVPVPLRAEDHGCRVDATILTPGSELVWLEGSGFPAGGELAFDSDSEGDRQNRKVKADAEGRYFTAMLPYKQGLQSGTLRVTLKYGSCAPTVKVPWGKRN